MLPKRHRDQFFQSSHQTATVDIKAAASPLSSLGSRDVSVDPEDVGGCFPKSKIGLVFLHISVCFPSHPRQLEHSRDNV